MLAALIITFVMGAVVGAGAVASVIVARDPPPFSTRITIPPPAAPNVDRKSLRSNLMRSREERITQGKSTQLADSILLILDYVDALERHVR